MAGQEPEWQRGRVRGAVWVVAKAAASTRSKTAATGGHRPGRGCRLTRVLNRSLQLSEERRLKGGEGGSRSRARGYFWKSERWPDSVVSGEEGGGTVTVLGVPGWRQPGAGGLETRRESGRGRAGLEFLAFEMGARPGYLTSPALLRSLRSSGVPVKGSVS